MVMRKNKNCGCSVDIDSIGMGECDANYVSEEPIDFNLALSRLKKGHGIILDVEVKPLSIDKNGVKGLQTGDIYINGKLVNVTEIKEGTYIIKHL